MNWCMESPGGHCKASAVCDQELSKQLFPCGILLEVLRRRVVSSPAHEKLRLLWASLCQGGVPCGIRSQRLRDLDQVVRIEHRCWSLCCFERVRSVRVFWDRLNEGWASGNWGKRVHQFTTIPTRSSTHDALVKRFMDSKLTTMGKVHLGVSSGPGVDFRSKVRKWRNWPGLTASSNRVCWEITLAM